MPGTGEFSFYTPCNVLECSRDGGRSRGGGGGRVRTRLHPGPLHRRNVLPGVGGKKLLHNGPRQPRSRLNPNTP